MEEIKKEVAELKVLVSKLLELQIAEYNLKYGFMKTKQDKTMNLNQNQSLLVELVYLDLTLEQQSIKNLADLHVELSDTYFHWNNRKNE